MKKLLCLIIILSSFTAKASEVIELKLPKSDKVVVKLMFKNGSMSDPKNKAGLTSLTANVIAEGGTKELSSTAIKDLIYPWASGYNVSVDKEVSIFTFSVHRDHLDKFYPVLKGLILTPRFEEEDFKRVKSNQQNYIDEVIRTSSDEEYSKKLLEDFLFRGSSYQHPVAGTSEGIKSSTLEDVKNHYLNYFTKTNLTIGIAGNYTPEFLNKLKSDMAMLPEMKSPLPEMAIARIPNGIEVEIVSKDNALGSAIFAGFPMTITRANDDFAALMIANSWLGEHRKSYSRLYQKIREQRSMNYGDYSYIEWYNNGGSNMLPRPGFPRRSNYFSIWIRPVQTAKGLKGQYPELSTIETGHAHFALRMAIKEMDELISKGMSKEDFELTREFLRSYMKLYAQTSEQQLGYLMDSRFYNRNNWLETADQLLAGCTQEKVNAAIKKYWQTKNMFITIVTDKSEAVPLARSLREGTESPMSYSDALKGVLSAEILKEDDVVKSYPMKVSTVTILESNDTFRK
ncbi:MAG: insulinase family protein [Bacteroidetes bacterium]|nr:insulinase family protein [Bacteroidota bacterium]